MRNRTYRYIVTGLWAIWATLAGPIAIADEIEDGLDWLLTHQNADKSWGGEPTSPATIFQATAETLATLNALVPADNAAYRSGLGWLGAQQPANNDYLARKLLVLALSGTNGGADTARLANTQNADGGWGLDSGLGSDLLDTSLVLRALSRQQYGNAPVLQSGLGYLLNNRNADGGLGLLPGESSKPYYTTLYLLALRDYQLQSGSAAANLTTAITAACNWLLAVRRADGGWGETDSSVFETALAAYSLAYASCRFTAQPTVDYLQSRFSNGAWNANAYETALALRALSSTARPNLTIGAADIRFTPEAPLQGETVTIRATVRNLGLVDTQNVLVRFYDGDPTAGGVLLGAQVIGSIAAGAAATAEIQTSWSTLGQRTVTAQVDPNNAIAETSENDNQAQNSLYVVTPAPDLTLSGTDISFDPAAPLQARSFTIQALVRNTGRLAASNVVVRFYEGDPAAGGVQIGADQRIPALAEGATAAVQISHAIESAGPHAIFVRLDPANVIDESREDNNQAAATVAIAPLPDPAIAAGDISFTPPDPIQGETFTIRAVVHNRGGALAPAFIARAYNGNPDQGGVAIGEWTVSSLAAGGELALQLPWSRPSSGSYTVYVRLDPTGQLTEVYETNNQAANTVVVRAAPDLTVAAADIKVTPAFPRPNQSFTLQATVRNQGEAAAGNVVVRFFNGDPASGGTQLGADQTIAAIPSGGSGAAQVTAALPQEGRYDLYVQIDPDGLIIEANESNNRASRALWLTQTSPLQWANSFVIAQDDSSGLYYAKSNGDGSFSNFKKIWQLGGGNSRAVVIADFDNDGDLDFIAGRGVSGTAYFYLFRNDGADNFSNIGQVGTLSNAGSWAMDMAAGDFNNDGLVDFIANSDTGATGVYLNDGQGGFSKTELSLISAGRGMDAADFNGDGKLDFARASSDGRIHVYPGAGDGTFGSGLLVGDVGNDPYGLAAADFDNDGKVDLIANNSSTGDAYFFKGNGAGAFASAVNIPSLDFNNYGAYDAYDLNADGNVDIVAVNYSGRRLYYYPGNGDGTFGARVDIGGADTNVLAVSAPPYRLFGAPYAIAKPPEQTIALGGAATLDGGDSRDSDDFGAITAWNWRFGDGQSGSGAQVSHVYGGGEATAEGSYGVALTVTDDANLKDTARVKVNVRGAPPVAVPGGPYQVGEQNAQLGVYTATLDGSGSTDAGGIVKYEWDFGDGWTDNFNDGDANGWTPVAGAWSVDNGAYRQTNVSLDRALALSGSFAASDYSIEADVTLVAGSGQEARLAFRALDADNRYEYSLRGRGANDILLYRWVNGSATQLLDFDLPFTVQLNTPYRLKAQVEGAVIRLYLNGSLVVETTDSAYTRGRVGLTTYRTDARFDNVALTSKGVGMQPTHTYQPGVYTASLTVTDRAGQTHTAATQVNVTPGARPQAQAGPNITLHGADGYDGDWTVTFDAGGSTDDVGIASYQWDFGDDVTASGARVTHTYSPTFGAGPRIATYTVTLTVTDNALQTSTIQITVTIDLTGDAPPVADGGGDYSVNEEAARNGEWTVLFDGGGSTDDSRIARYEWVFGDGGALTTWWPKERHNFFEAGTQLYGYDVSSANLYIYGTQNNTRVRIINLATGQVVNSNDNLSKYAQWSSVAPGDGVYFKVEADKPVVAYLTNLGNHTAFVPSLDNGPVGQEFIFYYFASQGFYVYAVEDALVRFYNTAGALAAERYLTAGTYWNPGRSSAVYHVTASGRIAMQNVGANGYTGVPASSGDGVGRRFYFATYQGTTGAFAVFAHENATVTVYDLDTGAQVWTQDIAAGAYWHQNGAGSRRLRLESTGDVAVWAGDTEGGNAIIDLGDDISFAGGKQGKEFYLHGLRDGAVVFAPYADTAVNVDGVTQTLNADGYLNLSGGALHQVTASKPVIIQTLGRANAFNDVGTYLGGVSSVFHRYRAVGGYNASLTVYDDAGQSDADAFTVTVAQSEPPTADSGGPYSVDEGAASGGRWRVNLDASGSTDDFGILRYEWDFDASNGLQVDATGPTAAAFYTQSGVYTVTLRVYDQALQMRQVTTQVTVGQGGPPTANAGGPYVLTEAQASYGVWTASLDGSRSSDDTAIYDYQWTFSPDLVSDFSGATLDATTWLASGAGVSQNEAVTVIGSGSWGARYLFSQATFERNPSLQSIFQARITPVNASGGQEGMWGFKNANTTNFSYTQMPYAVYFTSGSVYIYEDGSNRGQRGSYTRGVAYDVRITLKAQGALYEIKRFDATQWTLLYDSSYSSESPLRVGGTVASGTFQIDDVAVYATASTPLLTRTYTRPGVYPVTLRVRDNALQESYDSTTITVQDGQPPVANPGGPYQAEVGSLITFNGADSTDDYAIQHYDWRFGDTTGGPDTGDPKTTANLPYTGKGAAAQHFYRAVGSYPVTLTVTDNAGKTGVATTNVNVIVGNPPVARAAVAAQGAVNGPPVYFDAGASSDDFGVVEYRWDMDAEADSDNDGNPANDIDAVGMRPFYAYTGAPTGQFLNAMFDGATLDANLWLASAQGVAQNERISITGANSWGARYLFSKANYGRGRVTFQGQVRPVNASGDQNGMWGLKDSGANYSYTVMPHAIYFISSNSQPTVGNLQIYENGSNRGTVGSYTRGTLYDVRIDVKPGAGATYYIKPVTASDWTRLYDSTNLSTSPLKVGLTVYAGNFELDNLTGQGPDEYRATLTVEDGAGQTASATVPVQVAVNLPPNVITVPWVAFDPIAPHETYNGKLIHLKGIVRDADATEYQWDFGDGTQSARKAVTNPYDLSETHTYPTAPAGTPFVAVLKVWDSQGQLGQDAYNVVVRPKNLTTEINVAIDEGLWYLHQQQTRVQSNGAPVLLNGYPAGYWTSDARASATASSLQAFLINGHRETSEHRETPYAETVMRGFRYLFNDLGTVAIGAQTYGQPDTNGNGIGIETGLKGSGAQPIYQGGQVMDAIASSGTPLTRTLTGDNGIKRRRYVDILQDMLDQFAWGQSDGGSGGGWRYSWNADIDNSAAQWGAIGPLAAQDIFGLPIPQWVKDRNLVWLNTAYSGVGWGYTTGGTTKAGTPSGLVQLVLDDQTTADSKWQTAERWIAQNWDSEYRTSPGNRPYYAYYALTKAMRLAKPEAVVKFQATGFDWFNDLQKGLARTLIDDQEASGRFPGTEWIQDQLRSAWGVIILSRTLFVQPPVADAGRDRIWAVNVPLTFDGSNSYHLDPFRRIVKYEWDFDGDGVFDSSSDQPTATYTFTSQKYPTLPATITSSLRVTDNNVPPLTATDTVQTIIAVPPHPPVAEPGGPYACTAGLPCRLDGSRSRDFDPTDFIARYGWELDGVFPYDFDEAAGVAPTYVWPTAGTYNIGLKVWDNGVLNDTNGNGAVDEDERLTDQAFTTVTVVQNQPPVANAGGPYTVPEGSSIPLDGSRSSDPNGDPLQYAWDFDQDGQFDDASGVRPSFTGVDDGVYPVQLQVSDGLLTATAGGAVTVDNVAPSVDAGPDQTAPQGTTVNFTGRFTDPGAQDTHTIAWDFGDGANASGSLTPTHSYANIGIYTVTLTVTDDDDGVGSDTLTVTVQNVAPSVDAGPDQTRVEGDTVTVTASFTDPGLTDTHTATINWGDGSAVTDATVTENNGSGAATASHLYPDNGVFTVTVTVRDSGGASRSDTLRMTVQNAPPVVDAGADRAARVNQTVSLPPATFTDRGARDTHTARIDWGDGVAEDGVVTESNGSGEVAGGHVYSQAGLYTVTVTVTDKDGGVGSDSFQVNVTVGNEPPVAVSGGPYTVNEGGAITLDGRGSRDPNNDPLSFAWDLDNDGQFDDASTATVSFSRPDNGAYPVALRVADAEFDDADQTTVTVLNVAPTVIPGPNQSVAPGVVVQLTQTRFTDPGVLDTHTARIDWGDGATTAGVVTASNGDGEVAGSHAYANVGVYQVTVTVTDKDGGVGSGAFQVNVTVGNQPPVAVSGGPYTVNEGGAITLDGRGSTDPNNDPLSFAWDLDGDGQFDDASTPTVSFSRPDNGVYPVALRVADAEFSDAAATTVTVVNVAPTVNAGADQQAPVGQAIQLPPAAFTDAGVLDTYTARIDWGDGVVEDGVVTASNGSGSVAGGHAYSQAGSYTVTVTVTDKDGGVGSDTLRVTVQAPPPEPIADLQARLKADKVELHWTPAAGAERYTLYRRTENGAYAKLTDKAVCAAACVHVDFGLTVGLKYYYVVTFWRGGVESPHSNEVSVIGQSPRGR